MSSEELEQKALELLCIIDYDLYKECYNMIAETGEDDLVLSVMDWLDNFKGDE